MNLIPPIGATGLYKLAEPFQSRVNRNISYACMAVRRISDISATGVDPYEAYYEPYGIPQATYEENAASGVCIVSLQSNSGLWVYVPSSFIEAYPELNGVSYSNLALLVDLGALPDSLNLSYARTKIVDDLKSILGVTATVQTVVTSPRTLIGQDEHMSAEAARQANIETNITDYTEVVQLRDTVAELRAKITQLETYIVQNHIPEP